MLASQNFSKLPSKNHRTQDPTNKKQTKHSFAPKQTSPPLKSGYQGPEPPGTCRWYKDLLHTYLQHRWLFHPLTGPRSPPLEKKDKQGNTSERWTIMAGQIKSWPLLLWVGKSPSKSTHFEAFQCGSVNVMLIVLNKIPPIASWSDTRVGLKIAIYIYSINIYIYTLRETNIAPEN